ncbi:MAG: PepSY domain-containing protein [Sedimentisphaerales bacterium]|nr:PepSY domain-containing protein [Sedimentisphaerales bacterium]
MTTRLVAMGLVLVCLAGCESLESVFEKEKEIPLSEVPQPAIAAAEGAVEGITLTEAEMEEKDGQAIYELEGTANGKTYEIEVTADGKVLETEEVTDDD